MRRDSGRNLPGQDSICSKWHSPPSEIARRMRIPVSLGTCDFSPTLGQGRLKVIDSSDTHMIDWEALHEMSVNVYYSSMTILSLQLGVESGR